VAEGIAGCVCSVAEGCCCSGCVFGSCASAAPEASNADSTANLIAFITYSYSFAVD
jgi:hypothetical protein